MNRMEVVALGKWCQAAFPQQKWDQYTPDVWADLLADYPADDAKEAARTLATRQPWLALSDLVTEIKKIRRARFDSINPEVLGSGVSGDDVVAYLEKIKSDVRAIGDGVPVEAIEAGTHHPVTAFLQAAADRRAIDGGTLESRTA